MARRTEPSSSSSMASWAIEKEDTGKKTGLPLIVCPTCKRERVIELIVRTTENDNQGPCSSSVLEMCPGCLMLVELKFVVIDLEAGVGAEEVEEARGFGEEEAQSKCAGKNKMDVLISLLKM
ncbi:unnamed protein product [Miscanthus lutarioriparius]|uniref:Uncharacterized protein n=1 Tax=Miscanthus lutarioriparius TaxID=422564 RepID=A0A811MNW6_9POAL|nr:unnamed protein product [Miscanthus lutarioriparius]